MKVLCLFGGFFVLVPALLFGVDPLAFKLKGIGVGATKSEVSEQLKKGRKSQDLSVDSAGIEVFDLEDESSAPARIRVTLLDGKVVQIVGEYNNAEVERIGGLDSILERLKERLGPPSGPVIRGRPVGETMILVAASWRKPQISRIFVFGSERTAEKVNTTLMVADLSNELAERRRKSTSAGF